MCESESESESERERENLYIWFMRTQISIITWVLQHEGGLCPCKPKGLKNILNVVVLLSKNAQSLL